MCATMEMGQNGGDDVSFPEQVAKGEDYMKVVGSAWRVLPAKEKARYLQKCKTEKVR